jgi:hypothetical protein
MSVFLGLGDRLFGFNGIEYRFSTWVWTYWPKSSNENGLLLLRNDFFYVFNNVSWHSSRHFP